MEFQASQVKLRSGVGSQICFSRIAIWNYDSRANMNPAPSPISPAASSTRLMSLDVFRGATIAAMMLVNNPGNWGAVYKPFLHAEWHGWTFTDLVFPFFLWIVGVAIPLSTARRLEQGHT